MAIGSGEYARGLGGQQLEGRTAAQVRSDLGIDDSVTNINNAITQTEWDWLAAYAEGAAIADATNTQNTTVDSTTGVASGTYELVDGTAAYSKANFNNNFATVAARLLEIQNDMDNVALKINTILDRLQALDIIST